MVPIDGSLSSPVSFVEVDIFAAIEANRDVVTLKGWPRQTDMDNTLDDLSCDKRNHIVLKLDNDVATIPDLLLASALFDSHLLISVFLRIFLFNSYSK